MTETRRDERLLGPIDLAEYVGVPLATVYQWHHRDVGPRALKIGRHLRYRPRDVEKWLDEQGHA